MSCHLQGPFVSRTLAGASSRVASRMFRPVWRTPTAAVRCTRRACSNNPSAPRARTTRSPGARFRARGRLHGGSASRHNNPHGRTRGKFVDAPTDRPFARSPRIRPRSPLPSLARRNRDTVVDSAVMPILRVPQETDGHTAPTRSPRRPPRLRVSWTSHGRRLRRIRRGSSSPAGKARASSRQSPAWSLRVTSAPVQMKPLASVRTVGGRKSVFGVAPMNTKRCFRALRVSVPVFTSRQRTASSAASPSSAVTSDQFRSSMFGVVSIRRIRYCDIVAANP